VFNLLGGVIKQLEALRFQSTWRSDQTTWIPGVSIHLAVWSNNLKPCVFQSTWRSDQTTWLPG
jgi:hypothetical protein